MGFVPSCANSVLGFAWLSVVVGRGVNMLTSNSDPGQEKVVLKMDGRTKC